MVDIILFEHTDGKGDAANPEPLYIKTHGLAFLEMSAGHEFMT